MLASHPDIYVPTRRKEIFYFDLYYERGLEWYEGFFPQKAEARRYQAMGEITATYIYRPYAPERIVLVPSITKLILMVRNPVDRAYSHYGLLVKNGEYAGSFEVFLTDQPWVIQQGFYSRYLENFYQYFKKDQILVLVYELATTKVPETKQTLARFLGVATERFPLNAGTKRVNRSFIPRVPIVYALTRKVAWHYLRHKWNLDGVVNWGKRLGIEHLFGDSGSFPPIRKETRQYLCALYDDEIENLETLLDVSLDCWRE